MDVPTYRNWVSPIEYRNNHWNTPNYVTTAKKQSDGKYKWMLRRQNSYYGSSSWFCETDGHIQPKCGNGIIEMGESCDSFDPNCVSCKIKVHWRIYKSDHILGFWPLSDTHHLADVANNYKATALKHIGNAIYNSDSPFDGGSYKFTTSNMDERMEFVTSVWFNPKISHVSWGFFFKVTEIPTEPSTVVIFEDASIGLMLNPDLTLAVGVPDSGTDDVSFLYFPNANITLSEWIHIGVTVDLAVQPKQVSIFINSILLSTLTFENNMASKANMVHIGFGSFHGKLNCLAVYSTLFKQEDWSKLQKSCRDVANDRMQYRENWVFHLNDSLASRPLNFDVGSFTTSSSSTMGEATVLKNSELAYLKENYGGTHKLVCKVPNDCINSCQKSQACSAPEVPCSYSYYSSTLLQLSYDEGDVFKVTCYSFWSSGQTQWNHVIEMKCVNSTWEIISCPRIDEKIYDLTDNVYKIGGGTYNNPNTKITSVTCLTRYHQIGPDQNVTCTPEGKWEPELPVCEGDFTFVFFIFVFLILLCKPGRSCNSYSSVAYRVTPIAPVTDRFNRTSSTFPNYLSSMKLSCGRFLCDSA